jgi:hypothetical protein
MDGPPILSKNSGVARPILHCRNFNTQDHIIPMEVASQHVVPGGAAERAALRINDRGLSFGGERSTSAEQLGALLEKPFTVDRDVIVRRGTAIKTFRIPSERCEVEVVNVPKAAESVIAATPRRR